MKLIDLLVKELPKSGGWPAEAVNAIYFNHKKGVTFYDKDGMGIKNGVSFISMDISGVRREEVTKEEFEAALAKNDGWIEWGGGECPVERGCVVDYKVQGCEGVLCGNSHHLRWSHDADWQSDNIIAYRLHREINSRANDDRLEQDLNECIGQSMIAEKTGAEFPEVGAEVEYSTYGQKAWYRGVVTAIGESMYIVKNLSGAEQAFHKFDIEFRPIRTEAEKLRDLAIDAMTKRENMGEHWMARVQAIATYEAIAAGKIPGVNAGDK